MKPVRLASALLIGLALMGNGCSSLSPSAEYYPPPQRETNLAPPNQDAAPGICFGWAVLYWALYFSGELLAGR
jgi:hypothetical protein